MRQRRVPSAERPKLASGGQMKSLNNMRNRKNKMTDERMLAEIIIELHIFFDSDMNKVEAWINTENLNLGGYRPFDLILVGKIKRLYQFVMNAKREREL